MKDHTVNLKQTFNKKKLIIITLLTELSIVVILSVFSGFYIQSNLENDIKRQMLSIAKYGAANIQVSNIKRIASVDDPYFHEIKNELKLIEKTYGLREGLAYIVEMKHNKAVFSVMTNERSFRGDRYPEEAMSQIHDAFKGNEVTSDLYKDQNGEFISALVPLFDGSNVVAILEIDFAGEVYTGELHRRLTPFLIGLILLLFIPFSIIFMILLKLYQSHEREISIQNEAHTIKLKAIEEKEHLEKEIINRQIEGERLKNAAIDDQRRRFFAMVVHDLRTPMTTLFLLLDSLKSMIRPDANVSFMEKAYKEFNYIKALFDDITTLNNLQFSGFTPKYEKFDFRALLEDTAERLRDIAAKKTISFKLISRDIALEADKLLIQRVLNNLLTNAIQHGQENTDIQLNTAFLKDTLIVKISNSFDKLIMQEQLDQLFEPFVRLSNNKIDDTLFGPSSGLGLAICKSIVEAHQGRIFAHATSGNTISFMFEIPVNQASIQLKTA